ncbi:hypothetical protein [Hyphococcus luteus]|uniref:Cytochrome c domain-containing protein n=1 Tax=Hyphococcus luteus TaxID=2058213 RepID=A0A2S7KAF0_9PROT|nr:hypothetical protein [Marinicaulis flavus]PQA89467.1 hypothetical protein CW354_00920 [Marinicaulis flavus]
MVRRIISNRTGNGLSGPFAKAAALGLAAFLLGACAVESGSDASGPAAHGDYGAASVGLSYAREACASCHAVEAGKIESPDPAAPSFEALANRPDMTRQALAALLRSPHQSMPSLIVEADRVDDLAAYLASLGAAE